MSDHHLKDCSSDDNIPPDYDCHLQDRVSNTRRSRRFSNMVSHFSSWSNIKYYIIPVEIVVFFYIYLSLFRFQLFQQYVYQQSARDRLNISSNFTGCFNQSKIVELSDNTTFAAIQDNAKHILMVNTIVSEVPAIFVNMVLGGFADKYGRKPIFFFILTGQLIQTVLELVVVYFNLNMYVFTVGSVTSGLTGGFAALFLAAYAYIADITPKRWLTIRSGFLQVFVFVGKAVSAATSNSWLDSNGCDVIPPLWLLLVLGSVAVIYSLVIPESLSDKRRKELALIPKKGLQAWITGVKIYFKPYFLGLKKYWKLLVATAVFMLTVINEIGFTQILTYFLQNKPLEWHLDIISIYGTVMSVTHGVVLLIVLPLLVLIGLPDALIVFIGVVFTGGAAVFFGFAEHSWPVWLVFIGGTVQSLEAVIDPTLRSLMSKLVGPDDQGAMFSFLATIEMLCSTISSALFLNLYQSSGEVAGFHVSQSIAFWAMAGIWAAAVPLLLLLLASWLYSTCYKAKRYYYGDDRNMENEQLLTEDNGSEEKGTA